MDIILIFMAQICPMLILFQKSGFFKMLMWAFFPCISKISHSPKKDASGKPEI